MAECPYTFGNGFNEWDSVAISGRLQRKVTATIALVMLGVTGLGGRGISTLSGAAGAATRTSANDGRETKKATAAKSINLAASTVESGVAIKIDGGVSEATVRSAIRLIRFDFDTNFSGWTIHFKAPRSGYLGLTLVKQRTVELYLRSGRSVEGIAHDLAHELGHVADVTMNDNDTRSAYLVNRGLAETTPWWTCNSCGDLQVGAGDFAETFAVLVGPKFKFYSEVAPRPSADQLVAITNGLPPELAAAIRAGGAASRSIKDPVAVAVR
jgi:hypothetical protein